jgi:hypothetical protein
MFATDSDNAHVFREILEKIGAITLLHSIGTPDDFLSVIGQTDSAPPYLVITRTRRRAWDRVRYLWSQLH